MSALLRGFAQLQQIVIASNNDRSSAPTHQALFFPKPQAIGSRPKLSSLSSSPPPPVQCRFESRRSPGAGRFASAIEAAYEPRTARLSPWTPHRVAFGACGFAVPRSAAGFAAGLEIALLRLRRPRYPRLTFCGLDLLVRSKSVRPPGPEQSRRLTLRAVRVEGSLLRHAY